MLQLLIKSKELTTKQIELYVGQLVSVLADVNKKAMDKIREEEPDMGNYFKELFKKDLEKKWNDGINKGKTEDVIEMLKDNLSIDKIAQYTNLSIEQITAIGKQAALL